MKGIKNSILESYIERYKKLYQELLIDKRTYKKMGRLQEMERSQKLESKYSGILKMLEDIENLEKLNMEEAYKAGWEEGAQYGYSAAHEGR